MRYGFELHECGLAGADTTRVIREKRLAVPDYGQRVGPPFAARPRHGGQAVVAPYHSNLIGRFLPIRRWMLDVERWTFFPAMSSVVRSS